MADDTVTVEIVAKIDDLKGGLSEAAEVTKSATSSMGISFEQFESTMEQVTIALSIAIDDMSHHMQDGMKSAEESSKKTAGTLKELTTSVKEFFAFEYIKVAFEKVKEAFESTVVAAEEFGLQNEKIASVLGTTVEHAAGLSAALDNVGSSTDAYEAIALRLQHSLQGAGGASKELKDQFKDANGNFLSGAALMDRLQEVTGKYAEGADRTAVEVALLGRQTKAYYDISRVTAEAADAQTAIYQRMGVDIDGAGAASRKLEEATGNLNTTWKAEKILIGQDLMPAFTSLFGFMGHDGPALADALATGVKGLMSTFIVLKATVVTVAASMTAGLMEAWGALKIGGKIIEDITTGNVQNIGRDWRGGIAEMKNDWTGLAKTIDDETKNARKQIDELWAKKPKGVAEAKAGGLAAPAHLTSSDDKTKKGPKDNSAEEELRAAEAVDLEKVSSANATNQHLLSMGQETVEAFIAQERKLAEQRYNIEADALSLELAASGNNANKRAKISGEIALLDQKYADERVKINEDAESRIADVAKKALGEANKEEDASLAESLEGLKLKEDAGQISYAKMAEQQILFVRIARDAELQRLDDEIATLKVGTDAYATAMKERAALAQKFNKDESNIKNEAAKKQLADAKTEAKEMTSALVDPFKKGINDMILGGKSFGDSMADVAKGIESSMISMIENVAAEQIEKVVASALVSISSNAGVAASGAAASQASIPYVGPVLAVAAAGAMLALVMGYQSLAHASGGMTLDRDQLVFAHKDEMILPAHLSKGVQNIINNGGGGSTSNGGHTLNYSPTINGHAPANMESMLRDDNGRTLLAFLKQAGRDGRF